MYCTQDDLINRFGEDELIQLTDRDGSTGAVVATAIEQAITDAGATINGYLSGRYRLPLPETPANLSHLCADIARYYLYDDVLDESHQAARRYKTAIDYLKSVGKGELRLQLSPQESNASSTSLAQISSAGSVFAREKSKGFI